MDKKKNPNLGKCGEGKFIRQTLRTARKRHECYGCAGEVPIVPHTQYSEIVWKRFDGTIAKVHICQRCMWAMARKMEYHNASTVPLQRGTYMLGRLPKALRDEWDIMLQERREKLKEEKKWGKR